MKHSGMLKIPVDKCMAAVSNRLAQLPPIREPGVNKFMELNSTELKEVSSFISDALKNTLGSAYDAKEFEVRRAVAYQVSFVVYHVTLVCK